MINQYFKSKIKRVESCIFRWFLLRFCEQLTVLKPTKTASRLVDCSLTILDEMQEVLQ